MIRPIANSQQMRSTSISGAHNTTRGILFYSSYTDFYSEPYQVLVDSQILQETSQKKIDLVGRLQGVLGGEIKPMGKVIYKL